MPTTIFENGVVRPRPSAQAVQALVVRGGRVAFAGTVAECRDMAGVSARRIDLDGRTVVPGFTDSHVHSLQMATGSMELDLAGCRSYAAILGAVQRELSLPEPSGMTASGWFLAGGWGGWGGTGDDAWEPGEPRLADLDRVSGGVPVALHAADLHTYWLNTAALRRLGLLEDTYGARATGIISEATAFAAQGAIEAETRDELERRMDGVLESFLRCGVTGIHDIDGATVLTYFRAREAERRLPLRVHKITAASEMDALIAEGIRSGDGSEWLRYGGIKVFSDGSLSSHTCLMGEEYPDDPGNFGVASAGAAELERLVARCEDNGLAIAIHAIGDQAVRNAVEALSTARWSGPIPHRIEHFQHARAADVKRFAQLGGIACMQPSSCTTDFPVVDRILGGRDLVSYGWRSLLDAGATVAFSSDSPVETINPFAGIHAAITRQRPDGTPPGGWQPHERLTRVEAFEAYTLAAARASGETGLRGTLDVGAFADFAVLDRDPFLVDDTALLQTRVETTVVNGEIAWTSSPTTPIPN
ncbi:amidohydrolase [uncultured Microbacterium sp.]|uniref:amidohydrolase n=1 Tax=uncultured Microbacterium sp. TaxID=191216 RepID=UPI0026336BCB|nr:amidohydrolase [uncultured Microbacterium sp.]